MLMITLFLCLFVVSDVKTENVIITTNSGSLRGYTGVSTRDGTKYAAFLGVPFARPPVGDLRFKAPVPVEPWTGILNATTVPPTCFQATPLLEDREDCLYLNIYTPDWNNVTIGKAVMVFIHGGAFFEGTNDPKYVAPDFFMDHDVVYAAISYRLGPLGFLSLQNENVPGNAGLKDQVVALQWIKENVVHFGGDPDKITIFGQSAGGASVNFLQLSSSTKNLYSRLIQESGVALCDWSMLSPQAALDHAYQLGKKLSCPVDDVTEDGKDKLFQCLKEIPPANLTSVQLSFITNEEFNRFLLFPFGPTIEPDIKGAYITKSPETLFNLGQINNVPTMIGQVTREGLLYLRTINNKDPSGNWTVELGKNMSSFIPSDLLNVTSIEQERIGKRIKDFYFDGSEITLEKRLNLIDLLTDTMFILSIQKVTKLLADKMTEPVYSYLFSYDGPFNEFHFGGQNSNITGPSHGDELDYLFNPTFLRPTYDEYPRNSTPHMVIDRMMRLWTDFAKTGNPTPTIDNIINVRWEVFTSQNPRYIDIGERLTLGKSFARERMTFWNDIYEEYQNRRPFPE